MLKFTYLALSLASWQIIRFYNWWEENCAHKIWLWFCMLLIAVSACSGFNSTSLPMVEVAMGIYSGQPDPAWTLTPEQTETLLAKLDALPNGVARDDMGGLGYHGFYVRIEDAGGRDEARLTIYDGAVQITAAEQETWKADPQHALEAWLLDLATEYVDPALVAEARASLAPAP